MQIYYFTRTNRSKDIAEKLAKRYNARAQRITDGKNWAGALNYIKAGFMSTRKKSLPATYNKPSSNEPILLVFPIWAGTFPPVVRTFVNEVGRENITAIPTSLGSTLKDRSGFVQIIDLVGDSISAPTEL